LAKKITDCRNFSDKKSRHELAVLMEFPVGFRPHDELAAISTCEVCLEPLPSDSVGWQHFSIDPKQQQMPSSEQIGDLPQLESPVLKSPTSLKFKQECEHCGEFLQNENEFLEHINSHFSVMPGYLNCIYSNCQNLFANSADLREHVAAHDEFICSTCSKCFSSLFRLKHHMKTHLPRNKPALPNSTQSQPAPNPKSSLFLCHFCGMHFTAGWYLKIHVKKHETETPGVFKCIGKKCQHLSSSADELRQHSKLHQNGKFTSSNSYESSYLLNNHKASHLDERPFRCQVPGCYYSGKLKNDLYAHIRKVHDNPGCQCHFCGKHVEKADFRMHLQLHHQSGVLKSMPSSSSEEHKPTGKIACNFPGCTTQCESLKSLRIHSSLTHKNWVCDICDKKLQSETSFNAHLKSHTTKTVIPLPACENKWIVF
jgi:Zinc-finger of C2H2 type